MKYIITEDQLKKVKDKIFKISFIALGNDWDTLQTIMNIKGNPPFIITDDLDLSENKEIKTLGSLISVEGDLRLYKSSIESLGNLTSVGGNLVLYKTSIQSLGNLTSVGGGLSLWETPIKSLGNLTSVIGWLNLRDTPIQSLGNLKSVGSDLTLKYTPISKKYSKQEIRDMVKVYGEIYL
jgi:hypothetical protein